MHVQIRLPTRNIVLWSVPPTYEWGQGHNIELIRLVLEPNFLDPSRCQLLYYKLDRRPGNKANGAIYLGDEIISTGIHLREISKSFIPHKTDLVTILKMSKKNRLIVST